eukprot:TRINITY_DN290_c0_g1_i1.p1 TRINITY_DN290_c0_g1~~TRINITY_DN290_c0_g1_i1.p1  ORF type:complete len:207 (+),score=44.89 TRINITY_DN290_c0_g1_i1:111-731(+)
MDDSSDTQTFDLKLILLGAKNVGKTCIFDRFVNNSFGNTTITIGAYFGLKQWKLSDRTCNLCIWDTAGEEKFDSLTNYYCRQARAAVICYDITSYTTFQSLQKWVSKVLTQAEEGCSMIIVGNKLDLVEENSSLRKVETEEAKRYAISINASFIEVSARSGKNVNEAFSQVIADCYEKQAAAINSKDKKDTLTLSSVDSQKKSGCC